jgi:serine/threonine protein kinase
MADVNTPEEGGAIGRLLDQAANPLRFQGEKANLRWNSDLLTADTHPQFTSFSQRYNEKTHWIPVSTSGHLSDLANSHAGSEYEVVSPLPRLPFEAPLKWYVLDGPYEGARAWTGSSEACEGLCHDQGYNLSTISQMDDSCCIATCGNLFPELTPTTRTNASGSSDDLVTACAACVVAVATTKSKQCPFEESDGIPTAANTCGRGCGFMIKTKGPDTSSATIQPPMRTPPWSLGQPTVGAAFGGCVATHPDGETWHSHACSAKRGTWDEKQLAGELDGDHEHVAVFRANPMHTTVVEFDPTHTRRTAVAGTEPTEPLLRLAQPWQACGPAGLCNCRAIVTSTLLADLDLKYESEIDCSRRQLIETPIFGGIHAPTADQFDMTNGAVPIVINLQNNNLKSVPDGHFDTMPGHRMLLGVDLDDNLLTSLPIIRLDSLRSLSLRLNNIVRLDLGDLDGVPNLRMLDLAENQVTEVVGSSFPALLRSLDLKGNYILEISLAAMQSLLGGGLSDSLRFQHDVSKFVNASACEANPRADPITQGSSGSCVFPFSFAGVTHTACVAVADYGGVGWCSFDAEFVAGTSRWGYCTMGRSCTETDSAMKVGGSICEPPPHSTTPSLAGSWRCCCAPGFGDPNTVEQLFDRYWSSTGHVPCLPTDHPGGENIAVKQLRFNASFRSKGCENTATFFGSQTTVGPSGGESTTQDSGRQDSDGAKQPSGGGTNGGRVAAIVLALLGIGCTAAFAILWARRSSASLSDLRESATLLARLRPFSAAVTVAEARMASKFVTIARARAESRFVIEYRQLVNEHSLASFKSEFAGLEMARSEIKVGAEVGRGQSGVVFMGALPKLACDVAVKARLDAGDSVVGESAVTADEALMLEALLLNGLQHVGIVELLAVVTRTAPVMICTELMPHGDLRGFLRLHRPTELCQDAERSGQLPTPHRVAIDGEIMVAMATRLSSAMAYLESRSIIHRDVAARNVLVGRSAVDVKMADLGAARNVHRTCESSYAGVYTAKAEHNPARWMPLEALREAKFSMKSDVFSFGVLLWEILTLGQTPWGAFQVQDFVAALDNGDRLQSPSVLWQQPQQQQQQQQHVSRDNHNETPIGGVRGGSPLPSAADAKIAAKIYAVATRCWASNPRRRPHFHQLATEFAVYQTVMVADTRSEGRRGATAHNAETAHVGHLRPPRGMVCGARGVGVAVKDTQPLDIDGYVDDVCENVMLNHHDARSHVGGASANAATTLDVDGYVDDVGGSAATALDTNGYVDDVGTLETRTFGCNKVVAEVTRREGHTDVARSGGYLDVTRSGEDLDVETKIKAAAAAAVDSAHTRALYQTGTLDRNGALAQTGALAQDGRSGIALRQARPPSTYIGFDVGCSAGGGSGSCSGGDSSSGGCGKHGNEGERSSSTGLVSTVSSVSSVSLVLKPRASPREASDQEARVGIAPRSVRKPSLYSGFDHDTCLHPDETRL